MRHTSTLLGCVRSKTCVCVLCVCVCVCLYYHNVYFGPYVILVHIYVIVGCIIVLCISAVMKRTVTRATVTRGSEFVLKINVYTVIICDVHLYHIRIYIIIDTYYSFLLIIHVYLLFVVVAHGTVFSSLMRSSLLHTQSPCRVHEFL